MVIVTPPGAEATSAIPAAAVTGPEMPTMPLLLAPLSLVSMDPEVLTRLRAVPAPVVVMADPESMLNE